MKLEGTCLHFAYMGEKVVFLKTLFHLLKNLQGELLIFSKSFSKCFHQL